MQGKTPTNVPELQGRRHRRRRQAEGHADQRHAGGQGRAGDPADQFPGARAVVRDRAQDARRRGQDQHRDAPARGRRPDHPLRARPADQGTAAVGPGPAAHRGDRRQAQAALRRRGEPQAAPHPVPRDHHRAGRGARPPQEADRRPRPVRRLQDPHGADGARQRLRVRRRHLRRLDPAPVRARGREGHPGLADARLPGGLPGRRLQGHRVRRLVPPGGQQRDVVQDGRLAGLQGRHEPAPGRRFSSR